MVSKELFTPHAILTHIDAPNFQEMITGRIAQIGARICAQPLSHTIETLSGRTAPDSPPSDSPPSDSPTLAKSFIAPLGGYLLPAIVRVAAHELGAISLKRFPMKQGTHIIQALLAKVISPPGREQIMQLVEAVVQRVLQRNLPLAHLIDDAFVDHIIRLLTDNYDTIVAALLRWLRRDHVRTILEHYGIIILRVALDHLTVLQRLFVSATQYDAQIVRRMPDILTQSLTRIEQELGNNRQRIADGLRVALIEIRRDGLGTLAARYSIDILQICRTITGALLARIPTLLDNPFDLSDSIIGAIDAHLAAHPGRIDEFVDIEQIGESIAHLCEISFGTDRPTGDNADEDIPESNAPISIDIATRIANAIGRLTPNQLFGLNDTRRQRIEHGIGATLIRLMRERVPDLIASFDIHQMVFSRIEGLAVDQVEGLILIIIARHLKWINLFGALFGAIIGGVQIILNLML